MERCWEDRGPVVEGVGVIFIIHHYTGWLVGKLLSLM